MTGIAISHRAGLGGIAVLLSAAAGALDIEPSITLAEVYTSNVNLESKDLEESDWVTRVEPRIRLDHVSSTLEVGVDYSLQALFYAEDSDRNEVYNELASAALLDLLGDDLRLRAAGSISQVNVDPELPVSNSNINTTGNRSDATIWSVGPEWRRALFGNSEVDGYALGGAVDYDSEESQDIETLVGRMSVHSDPTSTSRVTYDLAYEYSRFDYDLSGESVIQTAYLQMGWRVNHALELFALGGLDNDIDDYDDYSLSESRWEAGFVTEFGENRLRASVGDRYFGSTYSLAWDYEAPQAHYGLSYTEAPSTTQLTEIQELPADPTAINPDEPADPAAPDSILGRSETPLRYVLRRADAEATWDLPRSQFYLDLYWEQREDQTTVADNEASVIAVEDETSYGLEASFSWELGARSVAMVEAGLAWRELTDLTICDPLVGPCAGDTTEDRLATLTLGLDYSIGMKTDLGFRTGLQKRVDTVADRTDYEEFWASVQLTRTF